MGDRNSALPLVRLIFHARTCGLLQLPPYAGSMLRGAFGHALLALSPLPHPGGQPCQLAKDCPYCQVFATPPLPDHSLQKFSQMPHPFVIEPPEGGLRLATGEPFRFNLVLVGRALRYLPALIRAFERALRHGLGTEKVHCSLDAVHVEGDINPCWTPDGGLDRIEPADCDVPPAATAINGHANLRLSSPLRLQLQGRPVRAGQLTARTLLITLARRHQLLLDIHLGAQAPQHDFQMLSAQALDIRLDSRNLHWFDWGRYSQHQHREMKLGGLVGTLCLRGDLRPFAHLLHLGQWLHVGKNASFGLGGYHVEHPPAPADKRQMPLHGGITSGEPQ